MLEKIERLMSRNHFCILATATRDGSPQSTGVIYCSRGLDIYVYTDEHSVKVKNIRHNPRVAVTIPIWERRPFWVPPQVIQFQGIADILPEDDSVARGVYRFKVLFMHVDAGTFEARGCFLHIRPTRHINSYGVGVARRRMARHPEEANRRTPIT